MCGSFSDARVLSYTVHGIKQKITAKGLMGHRLVLKSDEQVLVHMVRCDKMKESKKEEKRRKKERQKDRKKEKKKDRKKGGREEEWTVEREETKRKKENGRAEEKRKDERKDRN